MIKQMVCASGDPNDLATTNEIALQVLEDIVSKGGTVHVYVLIPILWKTGSHSYHVVPELVQQQYEDNCKWIQEAANHGLACIGWFSYHSSFLLFRSYV